MFCAAGACTSIRACDCISTYMVVPGEGFCCILEGKELISSFIVQVQSV